MFALPSHLQICSDSCIHGDSYGSKSPWACMNIQVLQEGSLTTINRSSYTKNSSASSHSMPSHGVTSLAKALSDFSWSATVIVVTLRVDIDLGCEDNQKLTHCRVRRVKRTRLNVVVVDCNILTISVHRAGWHVTGYHCE
jgi:hypothetical protein